MLHTSKRSTPAVNVAALIAALLVLAASPAQAQSSSDNRMTFFVTSVGLGKGADLGGLAGADRHCQTLAKAAGSARPMWRAYLSTHVTAQGRPINARDRIGSGPWHNTAGDLIARDVADLHEEKGTRNGVNRLTALDEHGRPIPGRGEPVNKHDILTGSTRDGRAFPPEPDRTCSNWTSSGPGAAMVGHHDRIGLSDTPEARAWNSSHPSRGCGQEDLKKSGGDGFFYCFAVTYQ